MAIPSPDSRNYNQHWAGLLHQSKKCSNAQLSLSWHALAMKSSIVIFPYFYSLSLEVQDCSPFVSACLPSVVCGLLTQKSKESLKSYDSRN